MAGEPLQLANQMHVLYKQYIRPFHINIVSGIKKYGRHSRLVAHRARIAHILGGAGEGGRLPERHLPRAPQAEAVDQFVLDPLAPVEVGVRVPAAGVVLGGMFS